MTAHACSPVLLPSGECGAVGRLCGCLTDGGRHGRHGRRAGFRFESGDFADRMYARIVPSAQNAERVIQTFVSLLLTGAVHCQLHRVGREAVRQCKAADALLLGRGLLGICTECAVDRLAERFFIRAACQVLLGRLRGDNAHIGPLVGLAAQIGRADRALFAFQIAEQLNRCACVQTEIKYEGYVNRQERVALRTSKLDSRAIPEDIDYDAIGGLRIEAREKLKKHRPESIGQASRISGVNPADISVLLIYLKK